VVARGDRVTGGCCPAGELLAPTEEDQDPVTSSLVVDDPGTFRSASVEACEQLDGWRVRRLLEASHDRLGLDRTVGEVLLPVLRLIGDRWAGHTMDVSQEHLFSSTAERWLTTKILPLAPDSRAPLALLACGPRETHTLALGALETLLTHRGWAVYNLGAATPATSLQTALRVVRPAAVVVVAHRATNRAGAVGAIARLARATPPTLLYHAGGAFSVPEDREGVAGIYLGTDLPAAADQIALAARPHRN